MNRRVNFTQKYYVVENVIYRNFKRVISILPWHSGTLNDSHCNSSTTESGVLDAITGHGSTSPEGRTYYHMWGNTTATITVPRRSENPLIYMAASDPRTHSSRHRDETNVTYDH
ncbi:hypothetical protein AVEN_242126-1 [Araneus ventricosus]|uniref:Uncharacterized protein n=1 Tax=Araneus ventricosus TaxID=182803 RepID=A0A4Y2PKP9_ARAVE|nr:hypothetical protein AVEN_242126-1 [Araneus ventricosus]